MVMTTKATIQQQLESLLNEYEGMQESQSAQLAQLEQAFRTEVEIYKRGDEVGKLELRNEEVDRHNREIEESLRQCRKDVEDVRAKLASQSEEREEINAKLQILTY